MESESKKYKKKSKINRHAPTQTETVDYHASFKDFDNSFRLDKFKENFEIKIQKLDKEEMIFDMIGIDAPIANAFRRIIIAEIATIAIEKVVIVNNTSIIQDEVLAHRLGLIPIKVDPRLFNFKRKDENKQTPMMMDDNKIEEEEFYENEVIVFKLNVTCKKNEKDGSIINSVVKSNELKWLPFGNQKELFKEIKPVHDDIIIAKLTPGQTIDVELYCEKGIGKDHAKFSPVSTSFYRILPEIEIKQKIKKQEAKKMKELCPMNVFDIEDDILIVKNPRSCTMCRECIRKDNTDEKIKLTRVKDHFIFSIESVENL
eukprot:gene1216-11306_t